MDSWSFDEQAPEKSIDLFIISLKSLLIGLNKPFIHNQLEVVISELNENVIAY